MKVIVDIHRQVPAGQFLTYTDVDGVTRTAQGPGEFRVLLTERGDRRTGAATRRARGCGDIRRSKSGWGDRGKLQRSIFGRRTGDRELHEERRGAGLGVQIWVSTMPRRRKGDERRIRRASWAVDHYARHPDPRVQKMDRRKA